jgi:hypothetical protein
VGRYESHVLGITAEATADSIMRGIAEDAYMVDPG